LKIIYTHFIKRNGYSVNLKDSKIIALLSSRNFFMNQDNQNKTKKRLYSQQTGSTGEIGKNTTPGS